MGGGEFETQARGPGRRLAEDHGPAAGKKSPERDILEKAHARQAAMDKEHEHQPAAEHPPGPPGRHADKHGKKHHQTDRMGGAQQSTTSAVSWEAGQVLFSL